MTSPTILAEAGASVDALLSNGTTPVSVGGVNFVVRFHDSYNRAEIWGQYIVFDAEQRPNPVKVGKRVANVRK